MVDSSNDTALEKMFPISVRIFDINFGRVMTKFHNMNLLMRQNSTTAECMFNSINEQFEKHEIEWKMVSAIGVDNTNANITA